MTKNPNISERKTPTEILKGFVLSSFENFIYYFQKEYSGYKPNLYDYQLKITNKMEEVLRGKVTRLIINMPPRYRKTEIAVKMFVAYAMAITKGKAKFIHLSYSKSLALDNSEAIKDIITSAEYQYLFPEVQIKKDSKAKEKWYTTEGGGLYATASGGQVTGFGAGSSPEEYEYDPDEIMDEDFEDFLISSTENPLAEIDQVGYPPELFGGAIIIDDGNKPEDAESNLALNKINLRYDSTIKNRVNSRHTPIINIQQRIAPNDLSGHLIKQGGWEILRLQAIDENNNALCPAIHTIEELKNLRDQNDVVFEAQYQQDPKAADGLMYPNGLIKVEMDKQILIDNAELLFSSTDANQTDGNDYFCTWFWALYQGRLFIFDCILEQIATKNLKELFIEKHIQNKIQVAVIEQNNQQTFIGEVEQKLPCAIIPVTAKTNKLAKIIAKAHFIKHVSFLKTSDNLSLEKAIRHMEKFNKNGTSDDKHDDPEDAWTLGMNYMWVNYPFLFAA